MTALIFIAVLFLLILVHEWGHFITAKKTGMRVDEFGIGFPPKLFGIKRGETEYTLNALPIGGFVRIYGEDPTQVDNDDAERSFAARPRWAQAVVLIAGVVMNILLAWFLFAAVFMIGVPGVVGEANAGPEADLRVVAVLPDSPLSGALPMNSEIVGMRAGDTTLEKLTPSALGDFVRAHETESIEISYTLGEEREVVSVTPVRGLIEDAPDQLAIGVSSVLVETTQYGFIEAIKRATTQTINALVLIVTSIAGLLYHTVAGSADFSQVAGPIGIYNLVGDAAAVGLVSLMMFTAIISLNLAVINLFPFPALDGGRLLFVGIESIIRRPIDPIWTARLNLVGFILLITLMLAVTYKDILDLL